MLPLNPSLSSLPVYQPGRPVEEVARELGIPYDTIFKLASNENPLGPSPVAMVAMEKALQHVNLYPDGNAFYLKNRLAESLGVQPSNLILGNGSNEIIEFVAHALLKPGTASVVSEYCFAIYPIMTLMFGAEVITVPASHYGHDLAAMGKAITDRTRIVFVANPNNPTGTLATRDAVMSLIDAVPEDVLLVMDEAYIEYMDDPIDLLPLVRAQSHPNLILMRTFSKIYGLAGLRIGYGIGHPDFVAALEKVRQPFNINLLAQTAALEALTDQEHVIRSREINAEGLAYLTKSAETLGLEYVPSSANFLLIKVGDGNGMFEELKKEGIIVRPMAGYKLPEWIRISVGTPDQNARCVDVLGTLVANGD